MPSSADTSVLTEFKRRAETALPGRVARVVLYGSRARGDAAADSDWDVAVFLAGATTYADQRTLSDIAFDLLLDTEQRIQPVALGASQADDDTLYMGRVRRDGVAV